MKQTEQKRRYVLFLVSLGCAKNLVDTEVIAGELLSSCCELTFDEEEADLYFINTCAFLPSAREEAFHAIEEALEWKKRVPGRRIIVAGCLTEYDQAGEIRKRFPDVDLWTGVNQIPDVAKLLQGEKCKAPAKKPVFLYDDTMPRLQLTFPHTAYLKIADGCNNCCSYCAIPRLRGALRSRPMKSILTEARQLIANGVKELLVIAQDVTVYGNDRPESGDTLPKLLAELNEIGGDFILRLLYTHPAHYTDEFLQFMARRDTKVVPYFDIPLQHVSERILQAQNRHVSRERIEYLLKTIRELRPDAILRTTFICGLPGETAEEFNELLDFVKKQKFDRCGVFPYAAEAGTPSADFPGQVPERTKKMRAKKLMAVQSEIMLEKNRAMIGKTLRVLVDSTDTGKIIARGPADAPDIDNCIFVQNTKKLQSGDWAEVRITGADTYSLQAKLLSSKEKKSL